MPLFGFIFEPRRAWGVSVQAVTPENQLNNVAGHICTVSSRYPLISFDYRSGKRPAPESWILRKYLLAVG
ncbi:hypothetical protein [Winslowiella toletana]